MWQRSARVQYLLLAVVAAVALVHAVSGAMFSYRNMTRGTTIPRVAVYNGYTPGAVTGRTEEAKAAGLQNGDQIVAVNGVPYVGTRMMVTMTAALKVGDALAITYVRGGGPPQTAVVKLHAMRAGATPGWAIVVQSIFTVLPFFSLLIGLWVVLARPTNPHAWLILGVLAYFEAMFVPVTVMPGRQVPLLIVWNTLAQTAMPLCLMWLGVYFPERSPLDRRLPWVKWMFAVPVLALLPCDLWYDYGQNYSFAAIHWLSPHLKLINAIENIASFGAISWFFATLGNKTFTSTGDARRRLRVLYWGSAVGLTPLAVLVAVSLIRGTDLGDGMSQWVTLPVFGILLLFPISLAYAVVVQRAVDVRILLRQGTKYAFARHTVTAMRVLFGIWIGLTLKGFYAHPEKQRAVDVVRLFGIVGLFMAFRFILSKKLQGWIDLKFFREAYSAEQVMYDLSEEARNFTETAPLLETVTERIGSTLHVERIAIFLRYGDSFRLQTAHGLMMGEDEGPGVVLEGNSTTISTLTREKGPATVYQDDPQSWLMEATAGERAALRDLNTELLVPLPGRNRLVGVMALGPKRSEEPYSRSDRQLLQSVASQTGLALENAELLQSLAAEGAQRERMGREIEIAREVQERLFPQTIPVVAGIDLAGHCRPAQGVGGDYYDFIPLANGRLGIAIGDVSGKGISASLLMASLRASLRGMTMTSTEDLAGMLRNVNALVFEASQSNRYATFFYSEYDAATRVLTYVNAGHNAPLVLRGREVIHLEATGTVIGLLEDAVYEQAAVQLAVGDVVILFTDGISEAMTHDEEEWGEERMVAAVGGLLEDDACSWSAGQLMDCIFTEADLFTAGAPQHDDMTVVVCRVQA